MLRICIFRHGVINAARSAYRVRTAITSARVTTMDQICVFGATLSELHQAEEHLTQSGPLQLSSTSTKTTGETPPSTCTLTFHQHNLEDSNSQENTICGSFSPSKYFSASETLILGRILFTAASTASTQSIIQDNISKLPNGVLFVADKQIGGKGRGGNTWESPAGCLMFSTAFKLTISGQRLPFVQYLVTLAVVQAAQAQAYTLLEQYINSTSNSTVLLDGISRTRPLDIKIKWPNDIYANGLKIGGVLCHSSFRDGQFHVIMGVGVNVSNKTPTTCIEELIEKKIIEILNSCSGGSGISGGEENSTKIKISREDLLADVMTRLEPMLLQLSESGFKVFETDYYDAWLHSGQRVNLEEPILERGGDNEVKLVGVTVRGLSPHGYLMAEDDDGEVYELHPDGNSFDFFKGLVRKKINTASIDGVGGY